MSSWSDIREYINTITCFDHASLLSRTNLHYTTIPNIFPRWNGKKDREDISRIRDLHMYLHSTSLSLFKARISFHSLLFFTSFSDKSCRRSSARASRKWKLIRRISILPRIQSRINSAGFVPTTLRIDFRYRDVRTKGERIVHASSPSLPSPSFIFFEWI